MSGLDVLFHWLALNFTGERYMFYTKVQGLLWSLADVILVFTLLKLADVVRKTTGQKKIKGRYVLLYISALLTPLLIPARTPEQIFFVESIVCGIQFLILAATLASESRGVMEYLARKISLINDARPGPETRKEIQR